MLWDKGMTFREIGRLTERQVAEIIFHPRDKEGRIKFPDEEPTEAPPPKVMTLEEELAAVDQLVHFLSATGAKVDAADLKAKVRAKYGEAKSDGPT